MEEGEKDDHFIEIVVTEPQKVGEGMSSYIIYKVETKTNLPYFRKRNMCVSRRFSDFLGLHDRLEDKYLHAGRIIPPAPEKSVIGEHVTSSSPFTMSSSKLMSHFPLLYNKIFQYFIKKLGNGIIS